jgi:RNA polymerase sigma-70 factor (ECF subfamily)
MEQTLTLEGRDTVTSDESARAESIGRLFDRHQARLYTLALRMTWRHDEASDLVQECFLRAIEHRVPNDPKFAERWLVRVLVNLCRDRRRRDVVRRTHEQQARNVVPFEEHDPALNAAVRDAVLALPVKQRAVVVLHEIEGRTLQEVAQMLGVAAVTARWHLHVALRSLRKELSR